MKPHFPGFVLAPTNATVFGLNNLSRQSRFTGNRLFFLDVLGKIVENDLIEALVGDEVGAKDVLILQLHIIAKFNELGCRRRWWRRPHRPQGSRYWRR